MRPRASAVLIVFAVLSLAVLIGCQYIGAGNTI